ncbi:cytochrome c-type protein NapB [Rhodoblastus sphagnicola]|uniref:nitrate reductase cytochrome c-type subunit n=1 Tax=Rhodoblastus sphagnicola TaxID=333368 RepID=UPI001304DCC8|nr:nitrate reductase cytochrome c-type subunit [Rhodoblastus sphagnicola]MBB4197912.1 cytochrome c-type protein NapB [Rhodoblastus sphagnicola]
MKRIFWVGVVVVLALAASPGVGAAETDAPSDAASQPPLVPHSIDGYKITHDLNECLTCHQPPANEKAGARKVSDAHYVWRKGERLDKIAATRFICTQCHMAKPDAKPLPGDTGGRQ